MAASMTVMTSKRDRLAQVLDRTGVCSLILQFKKFCHARYLPILTYHSVSTIDPGYPYDPNVLNATPEEFEVQLEFLGRYFSVIHIQDLLEAVQGKHPLPPNPLMLTFDDGYRKNLEIVVPILRRRKMSAVFFIATDYIAHRKVYWWDRIHYLVKKSPCNSIELTTPYPMKFNLSSDRSLVIDSLLRLVKSQSGLNLELFLKQLASAVQVVWNREIEKSISDELILSWDEVRQMRKLGMDVQSHTRRHRVLQTINPEKLEDELRGSRSDLMEQLGEPIYALSFPVGRSISRYPHIRKAILEAGYQLGFSNDTGINSDWRKIDPLDVRRMTVDPSFSRSMFRGQLAVPLLAYTNPEHQ